MSAHKPNWTTIAYGLHNTQNNISNIYENFHVKFWIPMEQKGKQQQ